MFRAHEPGGTRERTMFAVIKTGGKQYKVAAEDKITVMTLPGEAGARIVFDEVLALFDGATNHVGAPRVAGASVVGEIVEQARGPKVYAFKKRRRKNSKRKRGHKQDLTIVRVTDILTGGDAPARAAAASASE
jgi:large subunit ribosomal protein L21